MFLFVCILSNSKTFHTYFIKKITSSSYFEKKNQWVSQQVYDYLLGFDQNFKNKKP